MSKHDFFHSTPNDIDIFIKEYDSRYEREIKLKTEEIEYSSWLNGMYVRIDNVMCTDDLEPYSFHVDKKCNLSDHYPVVGWVKWHGR